MSIQSSIDKATSSIVGGIVGGAIKKEQEINKFETQVKKYQNEVDPLLKEGREAYEGMSNLKEQNKMSELEKEALQKDIKKDTNYIDRVSKGMVSRKQFESLQNRMTNLEENKKRLTTINQDIELGNKLYEQAKERVFNITKKMHLQSEELLKQREALTEKGKKIYGKEYELPKSYEQKLMKELYKKEVTK